MSPHVELQTITSCCLSSGYHVDSLGTKKSIYACTEFLKGKQIMAAEKMW